MSVALELEWESVSNTPLGEGMGEGYHRGAPQERSRCNATPIEPLLGLTRKASNFGVIERFVQKGDRGKEVVRFEYENFKRVLRGSPSKPWRPVKYRNPSFSAFVPPGWETVPMEHNNE